MHMRKKTFYAGKKPHRNYRALIAYGIVFVAAAAIIAGIVFGIKAIVDYNREKKESRAENFGDFTWETKGFEDYKDIKCLREAYLVYTKGDSSLMGLMSLDGTPLSTEEYSAFACVEEPWRAVTYLAQKADNYKYAIDSATGKVTSKQYRAPVEPQGVAYWDSSAGCAEWYDSVGYIGRRNAADLRLPDGLYPIESHDGIKETGTFGYVDESLALVIGLDYSSAGEFSCGLAAVQKKDSCGYLGEDGKTEIPFNYESVAALEVNGEAAAFSFVDGYAPVMKDGKMGVIDTDGKTVVDFDYDIIFPGKAGVFVAKEGKKWGKITIDVDQSDIKVTTAATTTAPAADYASGTYTVNTSKDPLNIRAEASADSTIVAQIPKGTVVEVSKSANGWAFVKYHSPGGKDFTGWVKAQFLLRSEATTAVSVTSTTK